MIGSRQSVYVPTIEATRPRGAKAVGVKTFGLMFGLVFGLDLAANHGLGQNPSRVPRAYL